MMDRPTGEGSGRQHISGLETHWEVLRTAYEGAPDAVKAAQQEILQRYRPAIYRYLLACLGNADAAEEVLSNFSYRFIRGDFRNADPEKGRFRDLLKKAIYHLIIDYHKSDKRKPANLSPAGPEPAADPDSTYDSDRQFLDTWRATLLNKAWDGLQAEERRTGRLLHTVLHFRAEHPEMRSAQMAEELGKRIGQPVSADWVRKWLGLARDRFAVLLMEEVRRSLHNPTPESVEEELIDLRLYEYCKTAVAAWREELAQGTA
jgi:RNA polymerase sigma-70 factor (ECF subfamily)